MTILAEGDYGPRSLIEHRLTELGFPASFVWTWRSVGFLTLFVFLMVFNAWVSGTTEETFVVSSKVLRIPVSSEGAVGLLTCWIAKRRS